MIIKKIEWLSAEAKEAIVFLEFDDMNLIAFSQPCSLQENEIFKDKLYTVNANGIVSSVLKKPIVQQNEQSFQCSINARINNCLNNIVELGGLELELDCDIPKDLSNGDYVEFIAARIDIY